MKNQTTDSKPFPFMEEGNRKLGFYVVYIPTLSHYSAKEIMEVLKGHPELRHLKWLIEQEIFSNST